MSLKQIVQLFTMRGLAPVIAAMCPIFLAPTIDTAGSLSMPPVPETGLFNIKKSLTKSGSVAYKVRDLSYETAKNHFVTDLALSFNRPSDTLRRDDTKKYHITSADYTFVSGLGSFGNGSAQFYKRSHAVSIQTSRGLWLGKCGDLGSFTIEFRFKAFTDEGTIFRRTGLFTGKKRGIEISLKNGHVSSILHNMFERSGLPFSASLTRGKAVKVGVWYHYSLSFNRSSGMLSSYLDGEEQEARYITESGEPFNGVYPPSFGFTDANGKRKCADLPQALIGMDFSGCIDEFRISYRSFIYLERRGDIAVKPHRKIILAGRIPVNAEGIVTSPVYELPSTGTRITEFTWEESLEKDTFIWFEIRISDRLFRDTDPSIKWYRIKNGQRKIYLMKDGGGDFLRGKYCQWRAHCLASPDGKRSPELSNIALKYTLDNPPKPPSDLVAASADSSVVLCWKKNVDADIHGYRIFYGVVPGRIDGILSTVNGRRISNELSAGDEMIVRVNNDLIEENRKGDRRGVLSYPLMNNTVLYYFRVSAYDSYKPDTVYNHESKPSPRVTARPFAGTEIK